MAIQKKDYFTFLGGEVSPNLFKRVDMRAANKWFETAKNIFFDTTGGFFNRVGTEVVDNGYFSNDSLKLLKFIYNKAQSYEVVFAPNDIKIYDNKTLLATVPLTISIPTTSDIIYTQIGDVMYICLGNEMPMYTLKRLSNSNWVFEKFDYEIPPMLTTNTVKARKLSFLAETVSDSICYFRVTLPTPTSAVQNYFSGVTVNIYNSNSGLWETIFSSNAHFTTVNEFVTAFNAGQQGGHNISCSIEGATNVVRMYLDMDSHADDATTYTQIYLEVTDGVYGSSQSANTTGVVSPGLYPGNNQYQEKTASGSKTFPSNAKVSAWRYSYVKNDFSTGTISTSCSPCISVSAALSAIYSSASSTGASYIGRMSVTSDTISTSSYVKYNYVGTAQTLTVVAKEGFGSAGLTYYVPSTYTDTQNLTTITTTSVTPTSFNVTANFNFFENKQVGDVFSVDSVFTPSKDGVAGVNKTYYATDIGTGTFYCDPFWSNGDWRIVTSGLFAGNIEMQYSYDGDLWYPFKSFSSSIREQSGVKYSTNYNEYGTLDVDDNILLRLKFDITSSERFTVTFASNTFENRSYYRILDILDQINDSDDVYIRKTSSDGTGYYAWVNGETVVYTASPTPSVDDVAYSNTSLTTSAFTITATSKSKTDAYVQCIKYPIGTPTDTYEWSESAWSNTEGYPAICFTYQNRLCFAKTNGNPFTVWTSKTNNYGSFDTKIKYQDDDPITMDVVKFNGVSNIATVAALNKLFIFTEDAEYGIQDQGALTQANNSLVAFSKYGAEPLETQVSGNRIVFVEHGGKAARQLFYDFAQENYEAPDITVLYKHLLKNEKIIATDYIGLDYRTYLMLTNAGRVICYKYIPEQEITACSWFMHAKGTITNISALDVGNNTVRIYMAVDIGGRKQLEIMDLTKETYLDSRYTFTTDTATTTIDTTGHFDNGDEVCYFLNGIKHTATIENNTLTLEEEIPADTSIEVGYPYEAEATLIPMSAIARNGSANYTKKNIFKANFEYFDSVAFKVGMKSYQEEFEEIKYEDGVIGTENTPHSGEKDDIIILSSYLDKNMLSFKQSEPYKMNITNLQVEVDYGG